MNSINMNMNGMNPAASMNAMANGANGVRNPVQENIDFKTRLNTYIYDYLIKNEQYEVARALNKSNLNVLISKTAPRRQTGPDDNGEDSKEDVDPKKPADLPYAADVPQSTNENSFLLDWFQLFWEMWLAPQSGKSKMAPTAAQYIEHTKQQNKFRQDAQAQLLRQPGMIPGAMPQNYPNMMRGAQGQVNADMMRRAQQNSMRSGLNQQQMMMVRQQQLMQQQHMERAGSEVDMNGRPRTPSSGENAPSPSKRARIDGGQFPGQQPMPNGRFMPGISGQQMMTNSMHAHALLKDHDIDPNTLSHNNLSTFQNQNPNVQKRTLDAYSQTLAAQHRQHMPQAMNGQGGPMMQPSMDGMEYYGNGAMRGGPMAQNGGQSSSNHALQDYQMQLMLLEQQNKKRLLMARQEQDNNIRPDQGGMPGQPGFAQNMSPSGSRNGPSPNPSEQMKRGTPKMGQVPLPGSPMPDGSMPHGRGSPVPMGLPNGMNNIDMMQAMKGVQGLPMSQNAMRPPSSYPMFNGTPEQMEAMRQAQAQGRMPNGAAWQQGPQGQAPGAPQAGQPQNGQMGTPQTRNVAMPPPQNPAANTNASNANGGRPASPAQSATAGTPQTTNKPTPAKKGKADKTSERKRPAKGSKAANAAATPASESENPPPTPVPATPITPVNAKSFSDNQKNNANQAQATAAQANSNPPAAAPPIPQPPQDTMMQPDTMFLSNGGMDMSFASDIDAGDVLEQFDFDAFLENGDAVADFNIDASLASYGNFDGLEASTGDA